MAVYPIDTSVLARARRVLVLAVGGGNDSVSSLLLQIQLGADFGLRPESVDIAAMLPDCLDYSGLDPTGHPLVGIVGPDAARFVGGKRIDAFPEAVLARNPTALLPVRDVLGLSMRRGSEGLAEALSFLVLERGHDLVLAADVGGDFIAVPENVEVLSPMMDGYALHALRRLRRTADVPILHAVFGLGTDGESTPEMLRAALERIPNRFEGRFDPEIAAGFAGFQRCVVEPNRYSRTADFTLREILGEGHDNPAMFRARFHAPGRRPFFAGFEHHQDPDFYGRYILFDDASGVSNPFAIPCRDGVEWFLKTFDPSIRANHELNGQSYADLGDVLSCPALAGKSLFFGTPSRKFPAAVRREIAAESASACAEGSVDFVLTAEADEDAAEADEGADGSRRSDLLRRTLGNGLILSGRDGGIDLLAPLLAERMGKPK